MGQRAHDMLWGRGVSEMGWAMVLRGGDREIGFYERKINSVVWFHGVARDSAWSKSLMADRDCRVSRWSSSWLSFGEVSFQGQTLGASLGSS
jgi:hypothetical protein